MGLVGARAPFHFSPVSTFLSAYDATLAFLRLAFFVLAAVAAVIAVLDWLVRTRRINPFNPIARFSRHAIDPLLAPIERRVVRSGGMPQNAPWWALVAVVVAGIILLNLLAFLRGEIGYAFRSASTGPRQVALLIIRWTIAILQIAIIVRIVSSLFRISPYSAWVRWAYRLSEPILGPLRRVLPPLGMFDISPIVAWLLLEWVVRPLLVGLVNMV